MVTRFPDRSAQTTTCVAMLSTYPPDHCGIGRFASSLASHLADDGVSVDMLRILRPSSAEGTVGREVVLEFDPACRVSTATAGRRANRSDVAMLQHEFGIYGPRDGHAVLGLMDAVEIPVITVLHTVLPEPARRQRQIIERLAERSAAVVGLSRSATGLLLDRYDIDPDKLTVIPHGSSWSVLPISPGPRNRVLTWGLLGPGKGIERAIAATARAVLPAPGVEYWIVGQTHPSVLQRSGTSYRQMLESLAQSCGMGDRAIFDDRYQDEGTLRDLVASSDVVVLPYDNDDQISSGVLVEALAAGRPVVATAFPHAVELLSDGAGVVVEHGDEAALTRALETLLTDDLAYQRAAGCAAAVGAEFRWDVIARRYASLIGALRRRTGVVA